MCGICGFNWSDKKKIKQLADLINHRGPEQEGHHVDENVSLGHKRLSIIDLSIKGRQPMTNEDGSILILFNGEIYNFQDIKKELQERGHVFKSRTDTEMILHAYEEFGHDCVKRFNGQFAFCIYDRVKKQLFFARDRLGMKPIYYYAEDGKLVFGSELKCLMEAGVIDKEIDENSLNHYLLFGYTPLGNSILRNVKKLEPGHYMVYGLKEHKILFNKRYWRLRFSQTGIHDEESLKKDIVSELDRSIRLRLISDRPVGAFLSGGLDSSLIVAFMRKYVKNLQTFSISFGHKGFDESRYAKIVSKKFNTKHHEMKFSTKDIKKLLPKTVYYFDEPFADASTIPTFLLALVAKKSVTVSLSGTGGDELFAGYKRYQHYATLRWLTKLPSFIRYPGYAFCRLLGSVSHKFDKLSLLLEQKEQEYTLYPKLFAYFDKTPLNVDTSFFSGFRRYFKGDGVLSAFSFDQHEYLPNDLLFKEDMACLAHSLEGRFPFLDHHLVEFANSIPVKYKMKGGESKYILKKVAEEFLPHEIIYRRKQSFSVPFNDYFRKDLKSFTYDLIFNFKEYDYYDKEVMEGCWRDHQSGKKDYSNLFLTIIMFNLWYKKWML